MKHLPKAVVMVDMKTEAISVAETKRLRLPIIGLVDTNVDPLPVAFPVPGNDDSMRSCELVISTIGEGIEQAATAFREREAKRRAEEEERRRAEAEEKRRREEEERARQEAAAAAQAAEGAAAEGAEGQPQGAAAAPAGSQNPVRGAS